MGLLALILLTWRNLALGNELASAHATMQQWQWQVTDQAEHQSLARFHLYLLEPRDPALASARIGIGWNPRLHEGMIICEALPAPATGQAYQLWVLDPHEETPVSGGVIDFSPGAHHFSAHALQTDAPGFAITVEPATGSPTPTSAVLLAIAPPP